MVEELQAAVDLATSEDRDFTEAEESRQNEIHAEVNALDGKISKAEETEKILLRNAETKAKAVAVDMGASSVPPTDMKSSDTSRFANPRQRSSGPLS